MQRKDVGRYWPSETNWLTRMASAPNGGWVRFEDYAALLDRAERAEAERDALQGQLNDLRNGWANSVKAHAALLAERDAAFAAGQEEMKERAAAEISDWDLASMSGINDPEDKVTDYVVSALRSLPIKNYQEDKEVMK